MHSVGHWITTYRCSIACLVLLCLAPAGSTAGQETGKTVRLLTIGNSFSRNATHYLNDLAEAGGHHLIHRSIVVGGASLQLHAEKMQSFLQDPEHKDGRYASGRSLQDELVTEPWDFVTIQQASIKSHDLNSYYPFATQLAGFIQQHAPQAQLLVHQTWAYRVDDPRFASPSSKPGEPATQQAMYEGLSHAYQTITEQLGARRIPVGDAFYLADTDPKWGYRSDPDFDRQTAVDPMLPDQTHSLHVGWRWTRAKDKPAKLTIDGHHANVAGEYLGACVFYEAIFGESVVGNRFVAPGLDLEHAAFLQQTAHRAQLRCAAMPEGG